MMFVEPGLYRASNFIELARKKMVGAVDYDEPFRLGQGFEQCFNVRARAELVISALNKKLRLGALAQISQVRAIHGKSQTDEFRDAIVRAADSQSHPRSEAEPREQNRRRRKFR